MKLQFDKKEILGMIHLAGPDTVAKAMDEIRIYQEEGLSGIIIENYHGGMLDVINVLDALKSNPTTMSVGVNILPNEFERALEIVGVYDLDFIQLDHVAGVYGSNKVTLNHGDLSRAIMKYASTSVQIFGGVWPKYYNPIEGSDLKTDIKQALSRCHAVVVTGSGTGKETPLDKIKQFREFIEIARVELADGIFYGDGTKVGSISQKPLIIGAGLTPLNVREQLPFADGAIVGSAFKPNGRTQQMVDRDLVKVFMDEVKKL